ncbi:hypothetical protein B0J13DRAFT_524985 [Dactylonectria estremocensis]|uniref:Uncharacterized protein n=1 Tax=Dactylonectria estremocensis TaxID=1079267 RepID=A0A9P9EUW6_9HYPO|nr:hypothetical protein B0J13DRAFT_524985 [Dactylonectria estremocensis]
MSPWVTHLSMVNPSYIILGYPPVYDNQQFQPRHLRSSTFHNNQRPPPTSPEFIHHSTEYINQQSQLRSSTCLQQPTSRMYYNQASLLFLLFAIIIATLPQTVCHNPEPEKPGLVKRSSNLFEHTPKLIAIKRHSETTMRIPSDLCFIDVTNWDWNTDVVKITRHRGDSGAVQRYFEALDKGFLGQAIRERYAFDGHVGADGIVQDTGMTIDELVTSDLQENLDEDDDRLEATQEVLTQGLANTDDPGVELVRTMISMMDADPPAARRRRALRVDLIGFLETRELDIGKVDRLVDIMLEE